MVLGSYVYACMHVHYDSLYYIYAVCSMDDNGLCLAQNTTAFGVMVGEVIAGPCLNTNCSDPTCNSAVQEVAMIIATIYS